MKHLHVFDTTNDFESIKESLEQPYVVNIKENNNLIFNTNVARVPENSINSNDSEIYLNFDLIDNDKDYICMFSKLVKYNTSNDDIVIVTPFHAAIENVDGDVYSHILAASINLNEKIYLPDYDSNNNLIVVDNIKDVLNALGFTDDILEAAKISKEEFYTIN